MKATLRPLLLFCGGALLLALARAAPALAAAPIGDWWIAAYGPAAHDTILTLLGGARRQAGEIAAAVLAVVALLALAAGSGPIRRLAPGLGWSPGPPDLGWMLAGTLGLLAVLELPWLSSIAQAAGVSSAWLGWVTYAFIPARWLVALSLAVGLGLSRVPAAYGVVLFVAAYVIASASLFGRWPDRAALDACRPGVLLAMSLLGVRTWRRLPLVAPPVAVASALAYAEAAAPWFLLYARTVLGSGH